MTVRFGDVTQTAYSFWLYDLCDNYLELIKPIVGDKSEVNKKVFIVLFWRLFDSCFIFSSGFARGIAQSCLYLCLDYGLKLIHPIMPYVTEELWQRLPGRGSMGETE
ncbi:unnamed protein product, partial [Laminaria digitata]